MIPKLFCEGDLVDGFVAGFGRWGVDVKGFDHQPIIRIEPWRVVRSSFYLGQPVRVLLQKRRRDGSWCGEIIESKLPAFTHSDDRPLAILDEANLSGFAEDPDIARWRCGTVKAWSLSLALDLAGWLPVWAPDPLNRQRFFRYHPPSAKALYFALRNPRWQRLAARDWGRSASGKNNADRTALTLLRQEFESGRRAILITDDNFCDSDDDNFTADFPELLDHDFRSRIYHPVLLSEGVISIQELGLSARIPVELFK